MDEAAPQAASGDDSARNVASLGEITAAGGAAGVRTAEDYALEAFRWDWGEAYEIGRDAERGWHARRRDGLGGDLTGADAEELREVIRSDYGPTGAFPATWVSGVMSRDQAAGGSRTPPPRPPRSRRISPAGGSGCPRPRPVVGRPSGAGRSVDAGQ